MPLLKKKPPGGFMKTAKAKVDQKEIQILGEKWRSEVCNDPNNIENPHWKSLEEWKLQYEPTKEKKEKKEDSERVKKVKNDAAEKLKVNALSKVTKGISSKLLLIVLEVTSKLLTKVESEARIAAAATISTVIVPDALTASKLLTEVETKASSDGTMMVKTEISMLVSNTLNAMNGIVLSYRFDTQKKGVSSSTQQKKFQHFRHVATDQLCSIIEKVTNGVDNAGNQLLQIQEEIMKLLQLNQSEVRRSAEGMLDDFIVTTNNKIDEKVVETGVEEKLSDLAVVADTVMDATGMLSSAQQRPDLPTGGTNEMVHQFGTFLKQLILTEFDKLTDAILTTISELFELFRITLTQTISMKIETKKEDVKDKQQLGEEGGSGDIRSESFRIVEKVYNDLQTQITIQIQGIIDMLGVMMTNQEEGEGDGGDSFEDGDEKQ